MEREPSLKILIISGNYPGKFLYDYFSNLGHQAIWLVPSGMIVKNRVLGERDYNGFLSDLYLPDMNGFNLALQVSQILERPITIHLFDLEEPSSLHMELIKQAGCEFHRLPVHEPELKEILDQIKLSVKPENT